MPLSQNRLSRLKNYLENKFSNVEVVIAKQNLGYGKGNNLGISKVKSQYVFILNPDAVLEQKYSVETGTVLTINTKTKKLYNLRLYFTNFQNMISFL